MRFRQRLFIVATVFVILQCLATFILLDFAVILSSGSSLLSNHHQIKSLLGALGLLSSASAVFCYLITRIVQRPITLLSEAAAQLERGDFSEHRALSTKTDGELGVLVDQLEGLRKSILVREDALQKRMEQLEHQATHDVLTGLENRRKLDKRLIEANEQFKKDAIPYVFCALDLDRFKVVNDVSGHVAGDAMLVQIAKMLKHSVRSNDHVIRMGGDEFALLMPYCEAKQAFAICDRIRKNISDFDFWWKDVRHKIGVSVGVLEVNQSFEHAEDILVRADSACFASKEMGRDQVNMINMSLGSSQEKSNELSWIHRISNAISENKMVLFTQEVIPLQSYREQADKKYEVLVRYYDEELQKMITPSEFMGYLERQGLVIQLDKWVVDTAIEYAAYNYLLNGEVANYWINLSGKSISDENFLQYLQTALRQVDLPKGTINFEVTETSAIQNIAMANEFIGQFREMGCQIALDDFGTGLASFSNLKSLHIDVLKIDGSFVSNLINNHVDYLVVKSAIEVAKAVGISTVAEYIDCQEVLDAVTELGADYGQGFYWGKPTPFELSEDNMPNLKSGHA